MTDCDHEWVDVTLMGDEKRSLCCCVCGDLAYEDFAFVANQPDVGPTYECEPVRVVWPSSGVADSGDRSDT